MSRKIRRLGWAMLGLALLTPTIAVAQSSGVQANDEAKGRNDSGCQAKIQACVNSMFHKSDFPADLS